MTIKETIEKELEKNPEFTFQDYHKLKGVPKTTPGTFAFYKNSIKKQRQKKTIFTAEAKPTKKELAFAVFDKDPEIKFADLSKTPDMPKLTLSAFYTLKKNWKKSKGLSKTGTPRGTMPMMQFVCQFDSALLEGMRQGITFLLNELRASPLSKIIDLRMLEESGTGKAMIVNMKGQLS